MVKLELIRRVEVTHDGGSISTSCASVELIGRRLIVRRVGAPVASMYMLDGTTADLLATLIRTLGGER